MTDNQNHIHDAHCDEDILPASLSGLSGGSLPSLVESLTIAPSDSTVSEKYLPVTPRNQPIMTPEEREKKAKEFVLAVGLKWESINEEQRIRAMRIQSPDFTFSPTQGGEAPPSKRYTTTFRKEWTDFLNSIKNTELQHAFSNFDNVFFNEDDIEKYMVIRRQRSGVCSSHSSVTFQHYVKSCRSTSGEKNHKMIDISTYF